MKRSFKIGCLSLAAVLAACGDQPVATTNTNDTASASTPDAYVGCYTIEQGAPATIKISHDGAQYLMQMKEGADKEQVWDAPERLEQLPKAQGWKHFSTNSINLTDADVSADILVRPDEVLALAKLQETTANTNPMIDSGYAVALMGAVNTIYQVPCDETRVEFGSQ
ncbi:hypothetical protein B0681_01880 [Moraxella porci DSM 25326]|uniref:Lipoprotein n=1 Tax=Moraxella porci DSM 25326 TaxID=573983 RepID=A0A1T0CWB0_9GAMM|nr:hypothetical protein [Moraxella porci]OOS26643.1 hypothetical protein B0681_01880 [Moraxella porci DSM 25326]